MGLTPPTLAEGLLRGIVGDVFDDGLFVLRLGPGTTVMVSSTDPVEPRSTVRFFVPRNAVSLTFYRD